MKNITPFQFLFLSLLLLCFTSLAFGQNTTHPEEVKALKDIGNTLGNKNWDTDIDPCSNQPPWSVTPEINVSCNCSIPTDTFCHVVSIVLKSQNLSGTLPSELVRLPYLQEIDLSLNYLNGTIPPQWGSMKLVNISILGNRVTGPIPKELGNITTLKSLVLEFNQLFGELPLELGNLPRLERLVIHGSGFSGPIPSGISFLNNLTNLRISDLKGPDSQFPQLKNLTILQTLVIPRSCNLKGMVPEYLGNVTSLRSLH
ncbi:hypothetical protein ACSQ67_010328 [Phaseolus vulgaris]